MIENRYHLTISPDFFEFEFVSIGPKGHVTKVVQFVEIDVEGVYSLGFGDKEVSLNYFDDLSVTNKGDSHKVLATVARTLYLFTNQYPDAIVIASGSTIARVRLYRIGITTNLEAIQKDFHLLGLTDTGWEAFRKPVVYHAYSVRRKQ